MAVGCNCNVGLGNTGRPGCVPLISVISSMILVPLKDDNGADNRIDLNALPTWSNLTTNLDASQRWFPLPAFENVELAKAESQFEEANSGRKAFLREGKRSFMGELWADDATAQYLGQLKSGRCVDFGAYLLDVNGNLIGSKVGDYLYPVPVDNASWDPVFNFATDSTVVKIMLGFDFLRNFNEATLYMITPDEVNFDFTSLEGLVDIVYADVVSTTTSVSFVAETIYGTALTPTLVQGIVAGDVTLYNNTTASAVAVATLTEGPAGSYVITFSAQTVGDEIEMTILKGNFLGLDTFTI